MSFQEYSPLLFFTAIVEVNFLQSGTLILKIGSKPWFVHFKFKPETKVKFYKLHDKTN